MQQQRGQKKSPQDDILMSFLMRAILQQRPGGWSNFNALSLSVVNLDEVSLFRSGHWPKMFLFLLEEMAYMYARIGTEDVDGLQVMAYEVLAMAEMQYRLCKRSTNPQDMTRGDAMSRVVLGDLSRLERLMWAVFDRVLVAGVPPELGPDESWEWVVCGIFDKLIYVRRNPSDQCPAITTGAKDLQGPGVWAEAPAMHSHHQGSEPTQSTNKGCTAPSVRSTVSAVLPEQVGYQRRRATKAYSDWDEGEDDQVEFDYGRLGTFTREGAGPPMVMRTSPNKSMKPDLQNVRLWFADMEQQLQEEADYPWWLQILPLASGVGVAAEESTR